MESRNGFQKLRPRNPAGPLPPPPQVTRALDLLNKQAPALLESSLLHARALYLNGSLDAALRKSGEILRMNPEESGAHLLICSVYVAQVGAWRGGRFGCALGQGPPGGLRRNHEVAARRKVCEEGGEVPRTSPGGASLDAPAEAPLAPAPPRSPRPEGAGPAAAQRAVPSPAHVPV